MFRSIRGRLQLWYAVVLLTVVGGFAGLLFYRVREARLQEVDDSQLEAATPIIWTWHCGELPAPEFDGLFADKPPPPWGDDKRRPDKGPPRRRKALQGI